MREGRRGNATAEGKVKRLNSHHKLMMHNHFNQPINQLVDKSRGRISYRNLSLDRNRKKVKIVKCDPLYMHIYILPNFQIIIS